MVVHEGLGAWVDVYDWTVELGGKEPTVDVEDIEAMADSGVQTVYLQTCTAGLLGTSWSLCGWTS